MTRKNRKNRPGRSAEHVKKGRELFEKICALFRPHVEPLCRKQCLDEIANANLSEEEIQGMLALLRAHMKAAGQGTPEDIEEALKEAETRMRDPKSITPEEIDQAVEDSAAEETATLVAHWLGFLMLSGYAVAGMRVIELQPLDDAMLPPLDANLRQFMDDSCAQRLLGEAETRDVLRQVRAALPAGQTVPEDAVLLLEHEGVVVIK